MACLFLLFFCVVQFHDVQAHSLKYLKHRSGSLLFSGLAAKSGDQTYRLMGETIAGMMQVVSTKRMSPENNCQKMKFLTFVGAYKPFRLSTLNEKGCESNNTLNSTLNTLQVYKNGNDVELVFKEPSKKEKQYHLLFLIPVESSSKQKFGFNCIKTQTCDFYLATEIKGVTYFVTVNKAGAFNVLKAGEQQTARSKYGKLDFTHVRKIHHVRKMIEKLTNGDEGSMPAKFHLEFL